MFRTTSLLVAAASLALVPLAAPEPAHAGGEGVAAGIIGFAAGAIVGSQINRNRPRRVYRERVYRPRRTSEERQYWRNVQASLNTLGFDAGPVDGAPGRKTRAAVTQFQMSINAVPNGKLTSEQAGVLFARVNSGGTMATAPSPYMMPGTAPAYQAQGQQPVYGAPGTQAYQGQQVYQGQQGQQGYQVQQGYQAPVQQPGAFPQAGQQATFPALAPQQGAQPQQGGQPVFPAAAPSSGTGMATAGTAAFPLVGGAVAGSAPAAASAFPPLAGANAQQAPQQQAPAAPAPVQAAPVQAAPVQTVAAPAGPAQGTAQPVVQVDDNGNQFVEVNGQRFYLNTAPAMPAPATTGGMVVTAETESVPQQQ
jgi:hypothetical protein